MLLATAGMLTLSLTAVPAAVIAGAAVFGIGFGVTQNASLTLMFDRAPDSGYSAVSALWNLAYDGGMGLGAAGFGVLAARTGYPAAFALTAAALPAVLLVARPAMRPVVRPVVDRVIRPVVDRVMRPVADRAPGRHPGTLTGVPGARTTSRSA